MAKKFYLVTGGAGFLGAPLVERLLKENYKVRVIDNFSRGSARRLASIKGKFEFIRADIRNASAIKKATKGVDGVCHLAFVNGTEFFYTKPELVLEVGVKGMLNVLDACLYHKTPELILASSSEVYQKANQIPTTEKVPMSIPDPLNPRFSYAGGKLISELLALNFGIKHFKRVVVFRPHNVYGPDMGKEHVIPQFVLRMQKLLQDKKKSVIKFPIQGTGFETRSFIYIDDFTDGLMRVIKYGKHREIYNIGTMDEIKISKLAQMVGACFGEKIKVVSGKLHQGSVDRRCPDIQKIQKLGFKPQYDLSNGLRITAAWYAANLFNKG